MSQDKSRVSIELPSQAKSKAGLARGYSFQDTISGACMLSVLFGDADQLMVEGPIYEGDKFDDLIIKSGDQITCIQIKNGIGYSLSPTDLSDRSGRLNVEEMVESARQRIDEEQGSKFLVLASYDPEPSGDLTLEETGESFQIVGDFRAQTSTIHGEAGTVNEDVEVEFGLGLPGIPEAPGDRRILSIDDTDIFQQTRTAVTQLLETNDSPRLPDVDTLIKKAIILASDARDSPGRWIDRAEIAKRLGLDPRERALTQQFPVEDDFIVPGWVNELIGTIGDGGRVLVEGLPGSGKSTGIELYSNRHEGQRVLRYHLFVPEDSRSEAERRVDVQWFRHQFAAQLHESFPDAFDRSSRPVWTDRGALQNYLDLVADWAEEEGRSPVIIVDGLDHVLRKPGESTISMNPHGTIIEELGELEFSAPLRLMLVSRELNDDSYDLLNLDDVREVPPWRAREIESLLDETEYDADDDLIDSILNISDGLPVIISHLVKQAQASELELQRVVRDAPMAEGDLPRYYDTIWEPLSFVERDIISLIAVSPYGINEALIKDALGLPSINHLVDLHSPPICHVTSEIEDGLFRVFHDSFGEHVGRKLENTEVQQLHSQLYAQIFEHCREFPAELDSLLYHAEEGPGRDHMTTLINLETAFEWLENGAHPELVYEMLQLLFEVALELGDYESAFDCAVIGAYFRDSVPHQQDRISFYVALGMREDAVQMVEQSVDYEPTSESTLRNIEITANEWADVPSESWIEECEAQFFGSDEDNWRPEKYFNAVAAAVDPDDFWGRAEAVVSGDDSRFVFETVDAARKYPELLDRAPPEWIFSNPIVGLEACSCLGPGMDSSWKEAIRSISYDFDQLSIPALLSIAIASQDEFDRADEAFERIREIGIQDPYEVDNDKLRHSQSYYIGAIYSLFDCHADDLRSVIDDLSEIEPLDRLLASLGAYRFGSGTPRSDEWTQFLLESIEEWIGPNTSIEIPHESTPLIQYREYVSNAFDELEDRFFQDESPEFRAIPHLVDQTESGPFIQSIVLNRMERKLRANLPASEFQNSLIREFETYVNAGPTDERIAVELWDIAIRAAHEGMESFAWRCHDHAQSRSFRYGNHKDVFLNEVWNALQRLAGDDWNGFSGVAIRLVNWARLLQDMTDGDETRHFEGMFLKDLLDANIIRYDEAIDEVREVSTLRKLHDWRMSNPEGINESQLESVLRGRGGAWRLRYDPSSTNIAKCAIIASENGWDEKGRSALYRIQDQDSVSLEENLYDRIMDVSAEYDIPITDSVSVSDSTDSQRFPEESEEEESDYIDEILENDPIDRDRLEGLSADELAEAGRRVANEIEYKPKLVVPIAREMYGREMETEAISLSKSVISERNIMDRWMAGEGQFEEIVSFLIEVEGDDSLQHVLDAWSESSIIDTRHHLILSNLVWLIYETKGEIEARRLIYQGVDWTQRLLKPHENDVHRWGILSTK